MRGLFKFYNQSLLLTFLTKNFFTMKNMIFIMIMSLLYSCAAPTTEVSNNSNETYAANLKVAQKFMQLHEVEDLESQIALLSDDLQHEPPRYGSEMQDKDGFINDVKMYQDEFENMDFNATYWLPVYFLNPFLFFLGFKISNSFSQNLINEVLTLIIFATSPILKYFFEISFSL